MEETGKTSLLISAAEALACYGRAIECMGPSPWMLANLFERLAS